MQFSVAALGTDPIPPCDIALTRNVWYQLNPEQQRAATKHLLDTLKPDGRLIIDKSDIVNNGLPTPDGLAWDFVRAESPLIRRRANR